MRIKQAEFGFSHRRRGFSCAILCSTCRKLIPRGFDTLHRCKDVTFDHLSCERAEHALGFAVLCDLLFKPKFTQHVDGTLGCPGVLEVVLPVRAQSFREIACLHTTMNQRLKSKLMSYPIRGYDCAGKLCRRLAFMQPHYFRCSRRLGHSSG